MPRKVCIIPSGGPGLYAPADEEHDASRDNYFEGCACPLSQRERGLPVDEASRQRIVTCMDLEQLERWLVKALSIRSLPELFEPEPPSAP